MAEGRRGLGRGLSALLGEVSETGPVAGDGGGSGRDVPIEHLHRNPDQPRRAFSDEELSELTQSIQEKGILQPILVRPFPGRAGEFQIVAGERRWRAAQRASLRIVPVIIREFSDLEMLEIGIIENVQRTDLGPIEEAMAYRALMERFGRTQDAVAQTVGKSRSHVANVLRLLQLPDAVQRHLAEGRLTAGHARTLIGASDPVRLANQIVEKGLSVRDAEALMRMPRLETKSADSVRQPRGPDADTVALALDLADSLGLKVEIRDRDGVGEVRIRYGSLEQLDELCQRLSRPLR